MRLATRASEGRERRDGALIVVRSDAAVFADAWHLAPTLQAALDDWENVEPRLRELAEALEKGKVAAIPLDVRMLRSPLPRAYEWVDGSAYLNHVRLVRRARGASPPETLETDPLVYQGGSGVLMSPTEAIPLSDPSWGLDFESEVAVILGDTPAGTRADDAERYIRLVCVANDVTLRNLVPQELAKSFGFFCSKPATAFSPFAVTVDELKNRGVWRDGRVFLRLRTTYNGRIVGDVETGPEMHFSFFQLIEHITRTRAFTAGTILGSGTVSNEDQKRGVSCLAEQRAIEMIERGRAETPFMSVGDTVEIDLLDAEGRSVCGRISQKVVAP